MKTIYLKRGDKETLNLTFTDKTDVDNPVPYSLTGLTVFFTVKELWDDSTNDDLAIIKAEQSVHTDAENGLTTIEISKDDMNVKIGEYKADIQIVDGAGDPKSTPDFKVVIENDTTKRTS